MHPPILSSYSHKNNSEGKTSNDFTEEKEIYTDSKVPPFLLSANDLKPDTYTSMHPFVLNKKNKINATQSLSANTLNGSAYHQPLQQAQFLPNNGKQVNDTNVLSRHNSIDLSRPHYNNLINLSPEKRAEIAPFNYSRSVEHFSLDTYQNEEKLEEIAPFHYSSKRNEKSEPSPNISPQYHPILPNIPKSNSLPFYNLSDEDRKLIAPFNDPCYVKPRTTSVDCDEKTLKQIAPFNDPEVVLSHKTKSTVPLKYSNKDRNIIAPFNDPVFLNKKTSEKFKLECKEEDRIKIAPFIDSVSPVSNSIVRKSPSKKSLAEISASPIIVSQQAINITPEMREVIAPFSSPNTNLPPPFELDKYNDLEKLDEIAPFRLGSPMKIATSQDILHSPISEYNTPKTTGRKSNLPPLTPVNDSNNKDNSKDDSHLIDNSNDSFKFNMNKLKDDNVIGPQRFTSRAPGNVASSEITIDAASNNSVNLDVHSSILSSNPDLKFSYKKPNRLPPLQPL